MSATLEGSLVAVCLGRAVTLQTGGRTIRTAFDKRAVIGPVDVTELGLPGDEHVYRGHGGPDMALLAYPREHYAYWRDMGLALPESGAMGENLTVDGLVERNVWIGDVFSIGTVVVQVTQPRSPCSKIGARYGRSDLPKLMRDNGATGYLLRVLEPGRVAEGDRMTLFERQQAGVSVAEASRVIEIDRRDADGALRLLAVDALGEQARRVLEARLDHDD